MWCETCKTCKWYEPFCGVCCNGDSEHRADFRLKDETCEEWEENDGGAAKKNT